MDLIEKFYSRNKNLIEEIDVVTVKYFIDIKDIILNDIEQTEQVVEIFFKYIEIAPIAIDMLGEFDGDKPENYFRRREWFRNMSDDEFEIFEKFNLGTIIEIAKNERNKF